MSLFTMQINGWMLIFNSVHIGAAEHFARWLCRQLKFGSQPVTEADERCSARWYARSSSVEDWSATIRVVPIQA